ncbi:MFS transporter [Actinomadura sp. NTSP31]|uniref:MFS transporter n=1 Tax=Actinomadura sp. NTSP31 TaxID=1735447 RepID=UPI0035BF2FC7
MTTVLAQVAGSLRRHGPGGRAPGDGFDRRLLAPMMLGSVLNPVNSSIISVALVPIGAAFGAPPSRTAWLISALYLATAIGQPVAGRLIDLFGPRRLFLAGTALTGLAGVVGMLAPDLRTLIAARVLLGFGTCAGYPAAMSLIRSEAGRTGRDRPRRRPHRPGDHDADGRRRRTGSPPLLTCVKPERSLGEGGIAR